MSNPAIGHGREGYYIGENGEYTHYEAAKAIGEALVAREIGKTTEPTSSTEEECKQLPIFVHLGMNSRCRGDRSHSIGWKPVKSTKDMLESIKSELDELLKSRRSSPR